MSDPLAAMCPAKKPLQIQEAFQLAQKSHQNRAKLAVALKSTYSQVAARGAGVSTAGPPSVGG